MGVRPTIHHTEVRHRLGSHSVQSPRPFAPDTVQSSASSACDVKSVLEERSGLETSGANNQVELGLFAVRFNAVGGDASDLAGLEMDIITSDAWEVVIRYDDPLAPNGVLRS